MIPIPTNIPWKLIGTIAAALVLAAVLWWVGNRIRVSYEAEAERDQAKAELKTEREQNSANLVKIADRVDSTERITKGLSTRVAGIDLKFNGLQLSVPPPANLIQTKEKPGEPCPVASIGPQFFGVYNAAGTEGGVTESETR